MLEKIVSLLFPPYGLIMDLFYDKDHLIVPAFCGLLGWIFVLYNHWIGIIWFLISLFI